MFVANVFEARQQSSLDLGIRQCLPITLASKMMNVGTPDPHRSISRIHNSLGQFNVIPIARQVVIKSAKILP